MSFLAATGQSFAQARGVNNDGDVAFVFGLADVAAPALLRSKAASIIKHPLTGNSYQACRCSA